MKKRFIKFKNSIVFLISVSLTVFSKENLVATCQENAIFDCFHEGEIELKAGYFNFSDAKMRKIYDDGGLDLQLCSSLPIWNMSPTWRLDLYAAMEYFERSGHSLNNHQNTSIWSIPVNIGIKPVYKLNGKLQYFFTVGPRYFYLHQRNHSSYVSKHSSKKGVGLFLNTGFEFLLSQRLIFTLFGEYSYAKIRFHQRSASVYTKNTQVGGYTIGGSFGYRF